MKPYSRSDRVGELIQQILSGLLLKEIKDPRLSRVTITGVRMSRDLRIAKVYFCTHDGEKSRHNAMEGFNRAKGFIKKTLAGEMALRYMPEIQFYYDESFEYGAHIEKLIKSIKSDYGTTDQSTKKK